MNTPVTPTGQLQNQSLPAVYLDSSVLIDYWMTESMELPDQVTEGQRDWAETSLGPVANVMRRLLRSDVRLRQVLEIRRRRNVRTRLVTSAVALWELQEWMAEWGFKQLGAEVSGMVFLQRKGKKEIGDYLKKGYELWLAEGDEKHHDPQAGTSGLESLMISTWLNHSFSFSHGLAGILVAPIANFSWPPAQENDDNSFADPYMLAYLQLGLADIIHVLLANHLGCRYFASFDSDFRRAREFIEETGMSVLTSPEEVLSIL